MVRAIARALATHRCNPGTIPAWCHVGWVCCGSHLSPMVLSEFFGFPPSPNTTLQIPIRTGQSLVWLPLNNSIYIHVLIFFIQGGKKSETRTLVVPHSKLGWFHRRWLFTGDLRFMILQVKLQNFHSFIWCMGFKATLNFRNVNVALNP